MPEALGRRFLLFVDTEEEFDWSGPFRREGRVTAMRALPAFQARAAALGLRPTYLVTYPIVDDAGAASILQEIVAGREAAIGAQLHPWVTPPFEEPLRAATSFAGSLPASLERAKLATLTKRIEQATGVRPSVYRAGRYGVGPNTAAILGELGYRLDASIRPGFDYAREGGPDFSGFSSHPLLVGELLALPLGTGFPGLLGPAARAAFRAASASPLARAFLARTGLASRVPLTPEGVPLELAKHAVDAMLTEGLRLLSFSFHSPSLVPGHTPYVRTARDLANFERWWEGMFAHLGRRDVRPIGAEALIDALMSSLPGRGALR